MISLFSYSGAGTLRAALRERAEAGAAPRGAAYMLPSLANEDYLLDALAPGGCYFGSRPEVWSWDRLYRAVVPPALLRRVVDPPDHRLILGLIAERTLSRLDAEGAEVPRGARRSGFIDVLSASIRELLLEDVPPERLRPRGSGGENAGSSDAAAPDLLLADIYEDYLAYLDANALADNSQLPALTRLTCAEDCGKLKGRTLRWVGFLSFTGAQLKLIRLFERRGIDMEFFVPDPALPDFYDAGSQLGFTGRAARDRGGRALALTAADSYDQYDRVAREIALARAGQGALADALGAERAAALNDVGILTGAEDLPTMASALDKYGIPYESRAERSVADTPLVRTARTAWEVYAGGWPARRTFHLLTSPVFGLRIDPEKIAPRAPEGLEEWREALRNMPGAPEVLERIKGFGDFVSAPEGRGAAEILRALLALAPDDEWEARVADEIGGDCRLDPAVREIASARLEVRAKLERLDEQKAAIGEAGQRRFAGGEAIAFITSWGKEAATALPQPRTGTVRLYDSPPAVMVSHRVWIMTDTTPARYPGTSGHESLLSAETREAVNEGSPAEGDGASASHLPTLWEKRRRKEAIFRRLAAVGTDMTIFARPEKDSQGRPLGESPFVTELLADGSGWRLAGEISGIASALPGEGDILLHGREPGRFTPRDERGPFPRAGLRRAAPGKPLCVPLSALDGLLDCPFRFWCGVMNINPPEDVMGPPTALDMGALMHEVWERAWQGWTLGQKKPAAVRVAEAWDAVLGGRPAGRALSALRRSGPALESLRRRMIQTARAMDERESSAVGAGLARESVELERTLPPRAAENAYFVGRADRIDSWSGGRVVILDYKLGRSERYGKSLQAAAYAVLLSAEQVDACGFGFVCCADGKVTGSWSGEMEPLYAGSSRSRRPAVAEEMAAAAARMDLADDLAAGGVFTAMYGCELCKSCRYGIICRLDEGRSRRVETDDEDEYEE